jgi:hypothetical protein
VRGKAAALGRLQPRVLRIQRPLRLVVHLLLEREALRQRLGALRGPARVDRIEVALDVGQRSVAIADEARDHARLALHLDDKLSLATAGIGSASLKVQGRASHAGSAPEKRINALYELSHQVLQMRDLSDPATGLKMNWTVANAGSHRNVIPA